MKEFVHNFCCARALNKNITKTNPTAQLNAWHTGARHVTRCGVGTFFDARLESCLFRRPWFQSKAFCRPCSERGRTSRAVTVFRLVSSVQMTASRRSSCRMRSATQFSRKTCRYATSLLVDEARNSLDTSTTGLAPDSRLGVVVDVVAQHLTVVLHTFPQFLASFHAQ